MASFGTDRVVVLDGSGAVQNTIDVGGGPAGLALADDRLFVWERFQSDLAWIDLQTGIVERATLGLDPTPPELAQGRALFYDALDAYVRDAIARAEERALDNKRKTLKPFDL